jgi:hypothetical protein
LHGLIPNLGAIESLLKLLDLPLVDLRQIRVEAHRSCWCKPKAILRVGPLQWERINRSRARQVRRRRDQTQGHVSRFLHNGRRELVACAGEAAQLQLLEAVVSFKRAKRISTRYGAMVSL